MTNGEKRARKGGFKSYNAMNAQMMSHLYAHEPVRAQATPDYLMGLMKFCNNLPFKDLPLYAHGFSWHFKDRMDNRGITYSDVTLLVKWRLEHGV